ncbi:bifunctional 4-hydroxy-2-oxoglutarate aldolase/2-dehydro-3-deoxy-phosphogluconate aldolase [Formosa sp. PL04]|uniref:bifunctional 4-hydroxy-2-oxoglutarate aldolase/2-dehydro-3-deoxy-phosphogluconate aldolase n=1 Tax=Formosa sp. PL04 TaxID=3081755 RepID=UPI002980B169|nr:bifunctional 4-hydroxy-2-oxoglutarate aldolase/2-dehydro-3-deoxy-phosphogluconate aldolase [Formosa sp. PL04]MDW5288053.1 bifunctional 4-hydroxy-2-oxoglutarate aldolase/2-dehydro-3-deoxy-phosphogluconate aldolase [Formosa sp. PL04]
MQPIAQRAMSPEIIKRIDDAGVIAVLVIENLKHALPVAEALLKGGVDAVELTLRTPVALDAAKLIKKEFPQINLGFGTVLTVDQVKAVVDLGADFAVAPGCNPKILKEAYDKKLSFAPGIVTPSDIEIALEHGCRVLKLFPAVTSGGMENLKNMVAPYSYLGLSFIPLGGINIANSRSYLESNLITAVGGSWLAKKDLIEAENWDAITKNSQEIRDLITDIKSNK